MYHSAMNKKSDNKNKKKKPNAQNGRMAMPKQKGSNKK